MRHRKLRGRFGRSMGHRRAMLASLVCNLIERKRIETTLAKAKAARRLADESVTLAKAGTLAARRLAIARLRRNDCVRALFDEIAPKCGERTGGYTRIAKLGRRRSDGSEMAVLEWIAIPPPVRKKKEKPKDKPA